MQEFFFQINYDEASYAVMGYRGDEADVVIPKTYGGKPVTILFDKLFLGHAEITSVDIPETVTDIGEFVFDGCSGLKHLRLPVALENLWGMTFIRSSIEELVFPEGVRTIPPYACKDCRELKRVVCGAGLKKIHAWAFGGCGKLTDVVYGPDTEVSPEAFREKKQNDF